MKQVSYLSVHPAEAFGITMLAPAAIIVLVISLLQFINIVL